MSQQERIEMLHALISYYKTIDCNYLAQVFEKMLREVLAEVTNEDSI